VGRDDDHLGAAVRVRGEHSVIAGKSNVGIRSDDTLEALPPGLAEALSALTDLLED
jgi:hypothetical protein